MRLFQVFTLSYYSGCIQSVGLYCLNYKYALKLKLSWNINIFSLLHILTCLVNKYILNNFFIFLFFQGLQIYIKPRFHSTILPGITNMLNHFFILLFFQRLQIYIKPLFHSTILPEIKNIYLTTFLLYYSSRDYKYILTHFFIILFFQRL